MGKGEGVLNDYNERLFGKLNRSYVTKGEFYRNEKHKIDKEDD